MPTLAPLVLALLLAADPVPLVTGGEPVAAFAIGRPWDAANGALTGGGVGNDLVAERSIVSGNFHVRARLRMDAQDGSAASFFLGPNHFGFEGAKETIYVQGPIFDGLKLLQPSPDVFERGAWIDFEAIRTARQLRFLIDGEEVYATTCNVRAFDRVGFRPHRSTMHVSDFSLWGTLAVVRRPELEHIGIPWVDLATQPERREDVARVPTPAAGGADLVRSPDGTRLVRIAPARTARHNARLLVSDDDGASWSSFHELPASLNGLRHASRLLPDDRLVIAFRDVARTSPTKGDLVVWVGAFDDLIDGDEGDYRVRLLDDHGRPTRPEPVGIEVEPDGTIVATSRWIPAPETRPVTTAVRFTLDEVDTLVPRRGYTIPIVDLAAETHRQVVVDREPGQYLGHPTTVLLEDGRTMIAVYPKGHGRGAIVMKRSDDAGRTWSERLPVPESWATSQEVPTLHRVIDPVTGRKRIIMFSGLYPIRMAVTEDDGATWSELAPIGDYGGIVTMGCVDRLTNGDYMALFHDDGRFLHADGARTSAMWVYKVLSTDGGLTWSAPEMIATRPDVHLCEPGLVRSPDGAEIAVLLRENSRRRNSFVIFSRDEGKTWTKPRELPAALTGDRHTGKYAPDGRLFISFRDTTHESPTKGDWVGWVGTYEDIRQGREGQYRVRLMDNHVRGDCAYPGVEILPDGTYVCTTYGHWTEGEEPYIVSVRFTLDELDERAGAR